LLALSFLFFAGAVQAQKLNTASDFYDRGNARKAKGDLDGAIADYTKAIEIDPHDADIYYNRGVAERAKGDFGQAIADYSKAIKINPCHAYAYNNRGIAQTANGDLEAAIADYSKALEIDPSLANVYNNRAKARQDNGDLEGASADYTKAIELNPQYARAYSNFAWLLAAADKNSVRDAKRAIEYAQRAAKLTDWKDPGILSNLAAVYAAANDFEEAMKWQEKALSFPEYEKISGDEGRNRLQLYRELRFNHEPTTK
jgi:tetratricopeptide (TPR) repeat protein